MNTLRLFSTHLKTLRTPLRQHTTKRYIFRAFTTFSKQAQNNSENEQWKTNLQKTHTPFSFSWYESLIDQCGREKELGISANDDSLTSSEKIVNIVKDALKNCDKMLPVYTTAVKRSLKLNDLETANKILTIAQKNDSRDRLPYNHVLRYYSVESRFDELLHLFEEMRNTKIRLGPDTYIYVISANLKLDNFSEVVRILDEMVTTKKNCTEKQIRILASLLRQFGKMDDVLQQMQSLSPDWLLVTKKGVFAKTRQDP